MHGGGSSVLATRSLVKNKTFVVRNSHHTQNIEEKETSSDKMSLALNGNLIDLFFNVVILFLLKSQSSN